MSRHRARDEAASLVSRKTRQPPPNVGLLGLAYVGLWTYWIAILSLTHRPPFSALAMIFGLALPAILITAATSGRDSRKAAA